MTDIPLKEYVDSKLCAVMQYIGLQNEALKDFFNERFRAADRAIDEAKKDSDRRMEEANGLRKQLDKQGDDNTKLLLNYVTKTEHQYILDDIEELKNNRLNYISRGEHNNVIEGYEKRLKDLEKNSNISEGKASQSSVWVAYIFAFLNLIGLIIVIILKLQGGS